MLKPFLYRWLLPAALPPALIASILYPAFPATVPAGLWLALAVAAAALGPASSLLLRQRRQLRNLRQQQAYLSSIIDNAGEAFITIDVDGRIGLFNHAAERMFGYAAAELLDQPVTVLMPEPYHSRHQHYLAAYLQRGAAAAERFEVHAQGLRKNGDIFPLHLSTSEFQANGQRQFVGIIVDNSEQQRLEMALRAGEQRYRAVVDALDEGVLIHDGAGRVLACNPSAARILGTPQAELEGSDVAALWQDGTLEDGTPFAPERQNGRLRLARDGVVLAVPRDGARIWLRLVGVPLRQKGPDHDCTALIFNDITRMREADEQVHLLLRGIESMSTGVLIADARDRRLSTVFVNDGLCRISGYDKDEIRRRGLRFWRGDDNDPATLARLDHAIANAEPVSALLCNQRKDGSRFWNNLALTPIFDHHGLLTHFVAEQHDISAQVEASESVRSNEQSWREALESTGMGVFEYDVQSGAMQLSPGWLAQLGYLPDAINGSASQWNALIHPDDVASRNQGLRALLADQAPFVETRYRVRKRNGLYCWVLNKSAVIERDAAGQPRRVRGTLSDISLQKEAEAFLVDQQARLSQLVAERTNDLERALHEAHSADRLKDEFIANMSHEIRTPMNAIIGFADLALHTGLDEQQRDYLQKVHEAARSLLGIINDILDFSKYRSGRFTLDVHPFRLEDICRQALSLIEPLADQKRLRLRADWPSGFHGAVLGDALRLKQVLTNLLSNAVKFTENGYVSLEAGFLEETEQAVVCRFVIRDSGIGMDEETLANLFNQFMQADASTTRRFGGTGLGLAISRQLVEAMRGAIRVESQVGQGSAFTIDLPLPRAGEEDCPPQQVAVGDISLRGRRVLLVEDNAFNREYAHELLSEAGAEIDEAADGQQALDAAARRDYDLVLMDMQMPVMDGLEATRRIRALPGRQRLPIVAMTASARSEDRRQALAAGMDDYLSKPIDLDAFWQTLARWCPQAEAEAPAAVEPAADDDEPDLTALVQFDTAGALERMRGNRKRYGRMLRHFAEHWQRESAGLDSCVRRQDWETLLRHAHTLKGGARTVGAESLAEAASLLEQACEQPGAPEAAALQQEVRRRLRLVLRQIGQAVGLPAGERTID
ncbi:PAS domain S-box protein [Chromobacterium sp. CV08]|uniref:PAS domain S-box protein n=1 Tax=Chromobacterium sp. CV08 TaxID=3133274 RepID=UPI003DA84D15